MKLLLDGSCGSLKELGSQYDFVDELCIWNKLMNALLGWDAIISGIRWQRVARARKVAELWRRRRLRHTPLRRLQNIFGNIIYELERIQPPHLRHFTPSRKRFTLKMSISIQWLN